MNENEDEVNREVNVKFKSGRKQSNLLTISFAKGDLEIIRWLMDFFGTENRSEVVRTALRAYASQMQALQRNPGRPKKGEEGGGF